MDHFTYCAAPVPLGISALTPSPMPLTTFKDIPIPEDERTMLDHFITRAIIDINLKFKALKDCYYLGHYEKVQQLLNEMHRIYQSVGPACDKVNKRLRNDELINLFNNLSHMQLMIHQLLTTKTTEEFNKEYTDSHKQTCEDMKKCMP